MKISWLSGLSVILLIVACSAVNNDRVLVESVHDGDTFYSITGKVYRLAGLDCPEIGQVYGLEARLYTMELIENKEVSVVPHGNDKYGRKVVDVYVGKLWLNKALVSQGLAWVYKGFGSDELYQDMMEARKFHRGLWANRGHEPPFMYRQRSSKHYSLQ